MTKSALLIEMLDLLRNHPGITVDELAASLGRSERTIYRWLSELANDLHVPINCADGGYYLVNNCETNNISLTPEELLALRLSLKSAPFTESSPIRQQAESAWSKIRDSSPGDSVWTANELSERYGVTVTASRTAINSETAEILDKAITEHRRLQIVYKSQKSNRMNHYTVDPYAIVFRRHSWYMVAYCVEHEKISAFRLLRIQSAAETTATFKVLDGFSIDEYSSGSWEAWSGGDQVRVRVRFFPEAAGMLSEVKRNPSQTVYHQSDGSAIFEVTASGIEEIAVWIMGYGKYAEVLEPESLRDHIRDHVQGMLNYYSVIQDEDGETPGQSI